MSKITTNISIPVYNYNNFYVSVVTNIRTHLLEPFTDGVPSMDYLSFEEIKYVNGQSGAIRNGLIRFSKEQEEEIYNELQISDWENILTNENIKEYLLSADKDGLQRIIDIRDDSTFERVRGILVNLVNSGAYDVSNRVINLVQLRYDEFRKNINKSQIILRDKNIDKSEVPTKEVEDLKVQNQMLQDQMTNMQQMMEKLMAMQSGNTETIKSNSTVDVATEKKVGRPTTKNK